MKRAAGRAWRAVWALWTSNLVLAALFGVAALGTITDPVAKGELTWKSWILAAAATYWLAQALKYFKAYLWEDMRFELIRPGGQGSGGGGDEKPETAAPVLPITKEEMMCN